jgi:hypothetical protein
MSRRIAEGETIPEQERTIFGKELRRRLEIDCRAHAVWRGVTGVNVDGKRKVLEATFNLELNDSMGAEMDEYRLILKEDSKRRKIIKTMRRRIERITEEVHGGSAPGPPRLRRARVSDVSSVLSWYLSARAGDGG